MTEKTEKPRISGKEATHVAMEAQKYGPVRIGATDDSTPNSDEPADEAQVPAQVNGTPDSGHARKAPPRVRKLSPLHDQYLAPTPDLESYRARLREAFGNTMSDEFVDVMLGKVVEALKPSPFDTLEESTLNAALAIIDSVQCRSELEALIAVEIVATGFSGLRFLRQSHKNMTEEYVSVYGNYANKLLRLHNAVRVEFSTEQHRQTPSQQGGQTGGRLRARSGDFSYPDCRSSRRALASQRAGGFAPTQHPQTPTPERLRG
jgi:hypothetical protein